MRFLVDTNILMDIAQRRKPGGLESMAFFRAAVAHDKVELFTAWHSISNVSYILGKGGRKDFAQSIVKTIIAFSEVPPGSTEEVKRALDLRFGDFEDALQVAVAELSGADYIVTRNQKDFKKSPIAILSPIEALEILKEDRGDASRS